MNIDFYKLLNFKYLVQTPPSTFVFFVPIITIIGILFCIWVLFMYYYVFKIEKGSPKFKYFKKVSWTAFIFSVILTFVLYARRVFIPMYTRLDIIVLLFFTVVLFCVFFYYFLFSLGKDTVDYYKEITKRKYMPKKLKKRK